MNRAAPLLALALALVALPLSAQAKDLNGRIGIGGAQSFGGLSSLSVRFGFPTGKPTLNVGVGAEAGVDMVAGGDTAYFAGGRLYFGVVAEDNMNLYLGAGGGFSSASHVTPATTDAEGEPVAAKTTTETALRVSPSIGAEFFLFGLDNLGFLAELAVNVDLGAATQISTVASPSVGFHYYF